MIPKILHLYWGANKKLSFLRYLTAWTFAKQNPDWEIIVWHSEDPCLFESWGTDEQKDCNWDGIDYMLELSSIPKLTTMELDFSPLGIGDGVPEVIKSDIFRLYILTHMGGVWSDFDILYFNPMDSYLKTLESKQYAYVCYTDKKYFSIGFLMGERGNSFYDGMWRVARAKLDFAKKIEYQMVGSKLFKEFVSKRGVDGIGFIPSEIIYPYRYNEGVELFGERLHWDRYRTGLGVHWFGGSKECVEMDNNLCEKNIDAFLYCRIGRIVKELYESSIYGDTQSMAGTS